MKKRKISLALKLNLLVITIIVTISVILLAIGYKAYQRIFIRYGANLETAAADIRSDNDVYGVYGRMMKHLFECFQLEGFDEAHSTYLEDGFSDTLAAWMKTIPGLEGTDYETLSDEYMDFLISMDNVCKDKDIDAVVAVAETGEGWMQLFRTERQELLLSYANAIYTGIPSDNAYIPANGTGAKLISPDQRYEMADFVRFTQEGFNGGIWLISDVTRNIQEQKEYLRICILSVLALTAVFIVTGTVLLKRIATDPLKQLSEATSRFASGTNGCTKEDVMKLDIRSNDEIGDLYRDIQSMQTNIVEYTENLTRMTAEKERARTELNLASTIQYGVLPMKFPPYPDRTEFDIYALMDPAREVGGDFYDFFLIDDNHLCTVIADVSGKGVPAALFMMTSKLVIKNCAMLGKSAAEILAATNNIIYPNNKAQMFVTAWVGILDISTGRLRAANAGHEYPVLYRAGSGRFRLLRDKHGFVIGGLEGMEYEEYEIVLTAGDKIFVYTDGVPEATSAQDKMFGTERLIKALNEEPGASPEKLLQNVRGAVDAFVKDAEQFDDLTMLCVEYR